jgi:hypothetical protein
VGDNSLLLLELRDRLAVNSFEIAVEARHRFAPGGFSQRAKDFANC